MYIPDKHAPLYRAPKDHVYIWFDDAAKDIANSARLLNWRPGYWQRRTLKKAIENGNRICVPQKLLQLWEAALNEIGGWPAEFRVEEAHARSLVRKFIGKEMLLELASPEFWDFRLTQQKQHEARQYVRGRLMVCAQAYWDDLNATREHIANERRASATGAEAALNLAMRKDC